MKSILLVEDSRFLRTASERAFAKAGYEVMTAGDGEEAVAMACGKVPDLILLDMMLPKMGGLEVLQTLRKNPVTWAIPVVVMSSLPKTNETKLIKDGATAYVEKSELNTRGQLDSLVRIVERAFETRNTEPDKQ